ncbi:MAG: GGDEF domain-containing protein [Bacilli bacterium]|nr:GGDEF domain-containing protein [Bacilli bacterium]
MKKTKNFYSIAIIFCIIIFAALIVAVGMLTRPDNHSTTKFTEPIELKTNWYIDMENDEDILWESLPYYNELRQDVFKVYNYLPNDLSDTTCIFLKTNFQSVMVEIEGFGVIYNELNDDQELMGERIEVLTHIIELKDAYAGKKITVISENVAKYQYPILEEVLIGEKGDVLLNILSGTVVSLYFIALTAILGLALIIIGILLVINKSTKYIADCLCLAIFTLLFDAWLICNISEIQCLINDKATLYSIYTFTLYTVLLPIFILLRNKCTSFTKLYDSLFIINVLIMIINFILASTTNFKLLSSSIVLHIFLSVAIILMLYTVFVEYFKHKNKTILSFLISGSIFFFCVGLTLAAYYFPNMKLAVIDYDFFVKIAFIVFVLINGVTYLQQVILASLKMSESAIYRKLAFTDLMTNLNNRSSFDHYLNTLTEEMFDSISILEVDIDGLKFVNDNFGHSVGDEMIKKVASEIKEVFGEYGKCFRIGGDEFEIIILNENKSFINLLIDRFKSNIDNMTLSSGSKVYVSIGATFDDGMLSKHKSIANLINITDRLMYENKHINKMNNHLE